MAAPPSSQPQPKRLKSSTSTLGEPSTFEEHLNSTSQSFADGNYEATWPRTRTGLPTNNREPLVFQQIDVDEYDGKTVFDNAENMKDMSIVRMYGITEEGFSVLAHVHGFLPYFYVPAPNGFKEEHVQSFMTTLDAAIRRDSKRQEQAGRAVIDVRIVLKQSIFGYQGPDKTVFLQIFFHYAGQVAVARRLLEMGSVQFPGFGSITFPTFESSVGFPLRFMIDNNIPGASWVELKAQKYILRQNNATSHAQLEVDVDYKDIIAHEPEGDWSKIAPLRVLSFDIECAGRKGVFPDAKEDPVIQIANVVTIQGSDKPFIRNVFTLKQCAYIAGTHTLCFERETDLLAKWAEFIRICDPDIITGYNIQNFDFPYLLERAATLKVQRFPFLGRVRDLETKAKDSRFSSKALGTRDNKAINIEGRLQVDVLQIMQRDHKLRSYTLNSVSAHFLGEQKEDVHHSIIADLQNGNDETRRRLAIYCLKDAYLPQRLLDKLMCIINYIEMARVTGVPFNYLLTRGQQIKVISQLYRKAKQQGLLIPNMNPEGTDEQYEGATVIEPEKGYYDIPIATLDFTSLYPSIMMAHNLCYSTYIANPSVITKYGLTEDDYVQTPNNDIFLKASVQKGMLPIILEDLIGARKKAKADLKKETDPFKRAVLDGRQLALKVCDCVSYVIIKGTKDAVAYEKAEDPLYVLDMNIPIDTKYYLENQLANPLMCIFKPILGVKLSSLLAGDHVRTISVAAPTSMRGLMKFAVRTATCLGCRTPLPKDETAVCINCRPKMVDLYQKHLNNMTQLEEKYSRLWTQCQRCQGSLHQDVLCSAQDCPIFYIHKKVQKDLNDASKTMDRFAYEW